MRNQRIIIRGKGGPEVLQLLEEEIQPPHGTEVRVRILAAGVAFGDIYLRKGFILGASFPVTPGYDFVGVIDGLSNSGVSKFKIDDLVAGLPTLGGYAKYINIDQNRLIPVPRGLDPAQAVAVVLNYTTAYELLKDAAKLQKGDSALIHAAAGGVGSAMLQLARSMGVETFGTADTKKLQIVRELGGTPIDYKNADFVAEMKRLKPEGVTAVFDAIGGKHLFRSNSVVKKGGTLVCYGFTSTVSQGHNPTLGLVKMIGQLAMLKLAPNSKNFTFGAVDAAKTESSVRLKNDVSEMLRMLQAKEISPIIAAKFSLSDAARAHELLESSHAVGKIILMM